MSDAAIQPKMKQPGIAEDPRDHDASGDAPPDR